MATYEPGKWFDITSKSSFEDFRKWCKNNNKSFFALQTNEKHSGDTWNCSWCKHFYKSCLSKSKFTDWMSTSRMYYCKGRLDGFAKQMSEDVGTSYGDYPYGYVYKNSNEYDYFCRPVSDDNGTAKNPTGLKKVYINTPDRLIDFLKKYEFSEPVTVTFKDWDGSELKTQQLEKGQDATPPSPPSRPRYDFTGWLGNYKNVQHDETVTAQYKEVQPDTDQGKLITASYCFGANRDITFQCSDGKLVYYLYPENYIVDSLENKITFDVNNATNGKQDDMPVSVRKTWVCPSPTISRTNYAFASWNSKKDGTGNSYVPGTSYPAPTKALTLYAQWTATYKTGTYVVLAATETSPGCDKLPGMDNDVNRIKQILPASIPAENIIELKNKDCTTANIKNYLDIGKEYELLIYLFSDHGGSSKNGWMYTYDGKFSSTDFYEIVSRAKGRVFSIFACCHAAAQYKLVSPLQAGDSPASSFSKQIGSSADINDDDANTSFDWAQGAIDYFTHLKNQQQEIQNRQDARENNGLMRVSTAVDTTIMTQNAEPDMLCWCACKGNQVSYMTPGKGHNMITALIKHFGSSNTYAEQWDAFCNKSPAKSNNTTPTKAVLGKSFETKTVFT